MRRVVFTPVPAEIVWVSASGAASLTARPTSNWLRSHQPALVTHLSRLVRTDPAPAAHPTESSKRVWAQILFAAERFRSRIIASMQHSKILSRISGASSNPQSINSRIFVTMRRLMGPSGPVRAAGFATGPTLLIMLPGVAFVGHRRILSAGGQESVLSVPRYQTMARALGPLPHPSFVPSGSCR